MKLFALLALLGLVACVSAGSTTVYAVEKKANKYDGFFTFYDVLTKGTEKGPKIGEAYGSCVTLPGTKNVQCEVIHIFPTGSVSLLSVGDLAIITGATGKYKGLTGKAGLTNAKPGHYVYVY